MKKQRRRQAIKRKKDLIRLRKITKGFIVDTLIIDTLIVDTLIVDTLIVVDVPQTGLLLL